MLGASETQSGTKKRRAAGRRCDDQHTVEPEPAKTADAVL